MRAAPVSARVPQPAAPTGTRSAWRAAVAACLLGPALAWAQPATGSVLSACRLPGLPNAVQCGVVKRPLDPARPQGVQIDVHYAVVPALARRKQPDPVFLLAGGPGQSAMELAPSVMPLFSRLNNRRDIVFVDQRGTGRSAPLTCADDRDPTLGTQDVDAQLTRLAACRAQLARLPHGDLRFFTTTLAMQDVDAVRRQLGAERINLVGASYGTRAALEMLRQFPATVRRSVMDGVAPPDMQLPTSQALDAQAALAALFTACEQDPACQRAHPALRADWAALLARLPLTLDVADPRTGRTEPVRLDRETLLGLVRGPLYVPAMASALPAALGAAAQGRLESLAGLNAWLSPRQGPGVAMGMHFSVVCAEDLPRAPQAAVAPSAETTAASPTVYERACADWPRGAVPRAFFEIKPAPSPVLLLSGGLDPVTPPRHGARVAQALGAQAVHVVVPNAGHGVMGIGCARDVVHRFIDAEADAAARKVDAGCVARIPRPAFFQPPGAASAVPEGGR